MASLNGICTEDLTYVPAGAPDPWSGEVVSGAPVTIKGRFVRMQSLMKNATGEQTQSDAVAIILTTVSPKIGEMLEGRKIEAIEDIKDRTRLLGYRLKF